MHCSRMCCAIRYALQSTGGIGHPEQLKGEEVLWSRRINEKDRLVYEVHEDEVVIRQCRGHYGDK